MRQNDAGLRRHRTQLIDPDRQRLPGRAAAAQDRQLDAASRAKALTISQRVRLAPEQFGGIGDPAPKRVLASE
jgi:hypothetical protein